MHPSGPATRTEAQCLLETGAKYVKRLGLRDSDGCLTFVGIKDAAASLYFGDDPIYHFDLDGRWQRIFLGGVHYLKHLDGSVSAIDRVRQGANMVLERRGLGYVETGDLDEIVRSTSIRLSDDAMSGRLEFVDPPSSTPPIGSAELHSFLDDVARWDSAAWFASKELYVELYGNSRVFLPPGCENAVVLEATSGTSGRLAFGGGPASTHVVRSVDEFFSHVRAAKRLWGRRIHQTKIAFLAGPDVLNLPFESLEKRMELVQAELAPTAADQPMRFKIRTFVENLNSAMPTRQELSSLKDLGLERIEIGVESGDRGLRELYGKSWDDLLLGRFVADSRASGLEVGVVLLAGVGGKEWADRHLECSARLLNSIELGPKDFISIIDVSEIACVEGVNFLGESGLESLSRGESIEACNRLKAALAPARKRLGGKVVIYNMDKQ